MFGRRPDGRRVNDIDPVVKITPYVMPQRCDAQIFLKHRTDMELLASYIHKQADKGEKLGYIPRRKNEVLAALMDAGKSIYARVCHLEDPEEDLPVSGYMDIDVYMDD